MQLSKCRINKTGHWHSDIYSDIYSNIYSNIYSGILSDMLAGVLSDYYLTGNFQPYMFTLCFASYLTILSGILSDCLSGIVFGSGNPQRVCELARVR